MNIFGTASKNEDPTGIEKVKTWKRVIVTEQRSIERDIGRIRKEEQKAMVGWCI